MRILYFVVVALLTTNVYADEQLLEQCLTTLESCDAKVIGQKDLIKDYIEYEKVCKARNAEDAQQISELEGAVKSCVAKSKVLDQSVKPLSDALEDMEKDRNRQKKQLSKTIIELEACVRDCTTPLWENGMLYIGILVGVAIGVVI